MITTLIVVALVVIAMLSAGCTIDDVIPTKKIKKWDECTKSSNWTGKNAAKRMMNMLSPKMSDSAFNDHLNFIKSRGCNTAHLIITNKGDGECSGYSIYGDSISWTVNKKYTDVMTKRIKKINEAGLGVVLWLATDDDGGWNKELAKKFNTYVSDISDLGWFKFASTVVLGLELDEYWNANQVASGISAIRKKYSGKVGVHMTSGKTDYIGAADILFYQTEPGKSASQIEAEAKKVVAKCGGKPVNFFELSRTEDRKLSEAAMRGGCYGCGNW